MRTLAIVFALAAFSATAQQKLILGMVRYDEKNPEKTSVTLTIKTESIDTDSDSRDNDLKSVNWFDAKTFPLITFKNKSVTKSGEGYKLVGDLTIKNAVSVGDKIAYHIQKPVDVHRLCDEGRSSCVPGLFTYGRIS